MYNLISAISDFKFYYDDWRVVSFCILVSILALALILVSKLKKDKLKLVSIISASVFALWSIIVVLYSFGVLKKEDFKEKYQLFIGVGIGLIIVGCLIYVLARKKTSSSSSVSVVYAGVCIAMTFTLSFIKLMDLPQGGSVSIARFLPLVFYSYVFGVSKGMTACLVYGLLDAISDPWIVSPIQFSIDYLLAFLLFSSAGLFKNKNIILGVLLGIVIGCLWRYLCHLVSGVVFFSSFAPEGTPALLYSLGYNSFVFVDGIICMAIGFVFCKSKQIPVMVKSIRNRANMKLKSA